MQVVRVRLRGPDEEPRTVVRNQAIGVQSVAFKRSAGQELIACTGCNSPAPAQSKDTPQ